jgi:hypothetical protein
MGAKGIKKIYLFKAQPDDEDAFEVRVCGKNKKIYMKPLADKLLSPFKMNKLLFMISANPEIIGGHKCYQMIPTGIPDTPVNKSKSTRKNTRKYEKYEL